MTCDCEFIYTKIPRPRPGKPMRSDPYYYSWHNIIQRTSNPKLPNYKDYGGRGIGICKQWRMSFAEYRSFFPNDIVKTRLVTIDRIDNEKGYCPHNVKLSSYTEQMLNRRTRNKKGLKGASFNKKTKKFGSNIRIQGKTYWMGSAFETEEDAHAEYCKVYLEWYGSKPYLKARED